MNAMPSIHIDHHAEKVFDQFALAKIDFDEIMDMGRQIFFIYPRMLLIPRKSGATSGRKMEMPLEARGFALSAAPAALRVIIKENSLESQFVYQ